MIKRSDLDMLIKKYERAVESYKLHGVTESHYYEYPAEVDDFMTYLQEEPWVKYDYSPDVMDGIFESISSASIDDVRVVLTGVSRAERFSDGYWKSVFETGRLSPVIERLKGIF